MPAPGGHRHARTVRLSTREQEVFRLRLAGENPTAIARSLGISYAAVVYYEHRIFDKYGVGTNSGGGNGVWIKLAIAYGRELERAGMTATAAEVSEP